MRRLLLETRRVLSTPSRHPRMAVVLGRLLGIAFLVCFGTGLYSHFLQEPQPWMVFPTRPQTLYQLSQGIHITAGIACFPLILGKLYVVYPGLFQTPPIKNFVGFLERSSIAIFVAASLVQITTGLLNTYQWYPFPFPFKQTHKHVFGRKPRTDCRHLRSVSHLVPTLPHFNKPAFVDKCTFLRC